jgi:glycosyltransferase involved in cell wall biosynthesis
MTKPLALSLIIPVYNEEQHLERCLDSVAAQTVLPEEVIVVDNNSTDNTGRIAKSYSFVRVIKEKKQGVVYARTAGFNAAKYGLIGRLDADCILPVNWVDQIQKFYSVQAHENAVFTGSGAYYNVPLPRVNAAAFDFLAYRVNRIALGHHFSYGSNMVLPKQIWQNIRTDVCMRTDIHEDVDISIHAHRAGYPIIYEPKIRVGTKLRRVFQDHDKLWGVLVLWPKTMRVHGNWSWPTGFFGAILLYVLTPLLYPIQWLDQLRVRLFARNQ